MEIDYHPKIVIFGQFRKMLWLFLLGPGEQMLFDCPYIIAHSPNLDEDDDGQNKPNNDSNCCKGFHGISCFFLIRPNLKVIHFA